MALGVAFGATAHRLDDYDLGIVDKVLESLPEVCAVPFSQQVDKEAGAHAPEAHGDDRHLQRLLQVLQVRSGGLNPQRLGGSKGQNVLPRNQRCVGESRSRGESVRLSACFHGVHVAAEPIVGECTSEHIIVPGKRADVSCVGLWKCAVFPLLEKARIFEHLAKVNPKAERRRARVKSHPLWRVSGYHCHRVIVCSREEDGAFEWGRPAESRYKSGQLPNDEAQSPDCAGPASPECWVALGAMTPGCMIRTRAPCH
eukprot:scaffold475_cov279-Pinguiococcus_pyrenoidosus.AAC.2